MEKNEITIPDSASVAELFAKRREQMSLFTPTIGNSALCAKQVTANNKAYKEAKDLLAEAKKPYLDKIEKAFEPLQIMVDGFKAETDAYQKANLQTKKAEAREKAKEIYAGILSDLLTFSDSIDAPDFEEIYDDTMWQKTLTALKDEMKVKIVKRVKAKEKCFVTFTFTDKYSAEEAERLMYENKIHFMKDEL